VPLEALGHLLDDLAVVLMTVARDVYVSRPESGVSGSVGGHVRHLLDHVVAFLEATSTCALTYDHRQRGTSVELDPREAIAQIYRLRKTFDRMRLRSQDEQVLVRFQLSPNGEAMTSWSTLGRELAFVMSHTVHHQAMIALLLAPSGALSLPARFGYAPSTPVAS